MKNKKNHGLDHALYALNSLESPLVCGHKGLGKHKSGAGLGLVMAEGLRKI